MWNEVTQCMFVGRDFLDKGLNVQFLCRFGNYQAGERLSTTQGKLCTVELQFVKLLRILCETLLESSQCLTACPIS